MPGFTTSLRFRLTVAFVLVIAACASLMGVVVQKNSEDNLLHLHQQTGQILARNLARNAELDVRALNQRRLVELLAHLENESFMRYATVFSDTGEVLAVWCREAVDVPESGKRFAPESTSVRDLEVHGEPLTEFDAAIVSSVRPGADAFESGEDDDPFADDSDQFAVPNEELVVIQPVAATERIGTIRLGLSRQPILDRLELSKSNTMQLVLVAILAGAFAAGMMIRSFLRPVTRLIEATEQIGQGRFDTVASQVPVNGEFRALATALDSMSAALRDMRGRLVDANGLLEQKVAERTAELQNALDELQVLDRMKDEFLSSVSHEFKTPLTSIRASAEILREFQDEPPETRNEFVDMVLQESERLTQLVNDILDLVKIESGELQWSLDQVDVMELAENALKQLRPFLDEHHLKATIVRREAIPMIRGDRERIHQVVTNLLSNAIKFSHEGGSVEVRASVKGSAVQVAIKDQGIGIEPKDQQKVFDRFRQVGDTLTEKPNGTGLGLPICKNIIERHGGSIWVESQLEEGSVFHFTLPMAGPSDEQLGRSVDLQSVSTPVETETASS